LISSRTSGRGWILHPPPHPPPPAPNAHHGRHHRVPFPWRDDVWGCGTARDFRRARTGCARRFKNQRIKTTRALSFLVGGESLFSLRRLSLSLSLSLPPPLVAGASFRSSRTSRYFQSNIAKLIWLSGASVLGNERRVCQERVKLRARRIKKKSGESFDQVSKRTE
jgi:hypothetical protein